jgi:hypothetical protein
VNTLVAFEAGSGPVLVAGGNYAFPLGSAAQWDGSAWTTLGTVGSGAYGDIRAFEVYDGGSGTELYAAGGFGGVGGIPARGIARWNGTQWSAVGSGLSGNLWPLAMALTVCDLGSGAALFVGGPFSSAGNQAARCIARWDGSSWWPLGSGLSANANPWVACVKGFDSGSGTELYAGGNFTSAGGIAANYVAKWNRSTWSPLVAIDEGTDGPVHAMEVFDDGSGPALFLGGSFTTACGILAANIAKWDGTSTSPLATGAGSDVRTLTVFDDGSGARLIAGGDFAYAGGIQVNHIAKWDGTRWWPLGTGLNGPVYSLAVHDDGSGPALFAAGMFTLAGGTAARSIARWDGASWTPLGGGIWGGQEAVYALASFGAGPDYTSDLFAGGSFEAAGGMPAENFARWRGCAYPVSTFCFGDGRVAMCPCNNLGAIGHGCDNSTGNGGARLYATGSTRPDSIVLHARGELPEALSIFLQGDALVPATVPFGDGLRCAGGHLRRLYVRNAVHGEADAPVGDDPPITARSAALGDPIAPSASRLYQAYYRDPHVTFCPAPQGGLFNITSGVRIQW